MAGVTINQLFMSGGTLILANPLTLAVGLQFSGGSITSGTLNIAGSSTQSALMTVDGTTINNAGLYDITFPAGDAFSGGGSVFNNSGTLTAHATDGSISFNISLNNTGTVSAESGTFILTGGGTLSGTASAAADATLQFGSNFTITDGAQFSGDGIVQFNNNTSTTLSGMITNNGNVVLDSTGNFTDFVLNGDVTFSGTGVLTLSNADRVRGSGTFTNAGNTINGETSNSGSLGNNEIGIVNQTGGVIDANVLRLFLNVDPSGGLGLTNTGIMQASNGGILLLNGNGGGGFNNIGGTITALDGSQVQLSNGAVVTGGTLSSLGTGAINNINTATLVSLTNTGTFIGNNNTTTTIVGTFTNTGSFILNSIGNFTDLVLDGDVTLNGGGTLSLSNADRVRGSGTLTNVDNIIQGETSNTGSLGNNEIGLINQANGLINANVAGLALNVDPNASAGMINQGTMEASDSGILLLNGNGGGGIDNTGGTILALDNSTVQLTAGIVITGGTLDSIGNGTIHNVSSATLDSLTLTGAFIADNNTTTFLSGTITDTGSITINSTGNFTDLVINGDVTLTGGSTLNLSNAARVLGGGTLFIGGTDGEAFTVQGETSNTGGLGYNQLAIVNRLGGLINANTVDGNSNGLALVVDPRSGDNLINLGTMEASNGGILVLTGNGDGVFNNAGGLIEALDGSQVQLTSGATINNGILMTTGTGMIVNVNTATLNTLTLIGAFNANNNTTTTLIGTITNTGVISINSTGNFTDLTLNGDVTLTGGGILNLTNADRVLGSGILTNSDNLIQGDTNNTGALGYNAIGIINQADGVINANNNGLVLVIDPNSASGLLNQGLIEASGGGILRLTGNGGGAFDNAGAVIEALDGSQVQLTSGVTINNGTLMTAGTGSVVNLDVATLNTLTLVGAFNANNNTTTALAGTITNTGVISINSTGNFTDLLLNGSVTLTGGGTINLFNADRVRGTGILTNVNNTIQGETSNTGSIGNNEIGIVNQTVGVIDANVSGLALTLDPNSANGLVNQGTMEAVNGGILLLSGNGDGTFSNSGTIKALTGGALQFTGTVTSSNLVDVGSDSLSITGSGTYTQTAGTFRLAGGTVTSSTALNFMSGLVDARGSITANITNSANLQPALGGSGLFVTGNVSLLSASKLTFQLGGLTQGSQYGFLNVNGTVALGGQLVVSFVNAFQAANNNNFTVLTSTTALSGIFTNVVSGGRVNASDGSGSFLVTYSGDNVILSDFQPSGFAPVRKGSSTASGAVANRKTPGATQVMTSDEPRSIGTLGRINASRVRTQRTGIRLQNSDQLRDMLEGADTTTAQGQVIVHPRSQTKPAGAGLENNSPNGLTNGKADRRGQPPGDTISRREGTIPRRSPN